MKSRPNILWCYKKELGFQSDDRSRFKKLKKKAKKHQDEEKQEKKEEILNDPFHLFLSSTDIRFCYFKETQTVLGQTFGMLVLQDFEGITPNILARTLETVEGGGIIVFLLPEMNSLKQLYTMTMDVHTRFRTPSQNEITPRFNERFLLSLAVSKNSLVLDDQLNILPLSSHIKKIEAINLDEKERKYDHILSDNEKELMKLKQSLKDTQPIGSLLNLAKTLDQGKSLLQFVEAISEKNLQSTVTLTAARGRGKSASLGLSIASAIAYGYSNIYVTSPTPENLKTVFDFVLKGFDALGYKDQLDYEIVQSTNPTFKKAIVRINIFKDHRQTIQYIIPSDYQKLGNAELLIIDEAAAIPLPIVRHLLGPYLVFMSSTINGYEGTGRSLSLKLIKELRDKQFKGEKGRKLFETKIEEPIRYASGDPIEKWLNDLLCLDATSAAQITTKCPHPSDCNLFYVNRDTLFSFNEASEKFLHNMMSLYVSSHYKNTPNDLQLMSDAPAHHLFVLLGPVDENTKELPDIFCVIQVVFEGKISEKMMKSQLAEGLNPEGDLIPYLMARQFQQSDFGILSGARIIRIATHPEYQKMGYGSRAMELFSHYYQGDIYNLDEKETKKKSSKKEEEKSEGLMKEVIKPRDKSKLPPLLASLKDRKPEQLDYLGVSFGLTHQLFNFWKKNGFDPVYLRLTENEVTGEHTCVVLKGFEKKTNSVISTFYNDFRKRFLNLLSYDFKVFESSTVLNILGYNQEKDEDVTKHSTTFEEMDLMFSEFDIKRLNSYSRNLVDYHVILDLVEPIAKLFFMKKLPFALSWSQAEILIEMGLQHKPIDHLQSRFPPNQILALFNKIIRKVVKYFQDVEKEKHLEKKTKKIEEKKETQAKVEEEIIEEEEEKGDFDHIFEEPLPESKKRKAEEKKLESSKKPKETKTEQRDTTDILQNDKFKFTGIADNLYGVDVSKGIVQLKTEKPEKPKKHHMKDEDEIKEDKEKEKAMNYKKGGKTKRKVKI